MSPMIDGSLLAIERTVSPSPICFDQAVRCAACFAARASSASLRFCFWWRSMKAPPISAQRVGPI